MPQSGHLTPVKRVLVDNAVFHDVSITSSGFVRIKMFVERISVHKQDVRKLSLPYDAYQIGAEALS